MTKSDICRCDRGPHPEGTVPCYQCGFCGMMRNDKPVEGEIVHLRERRGTQYVHTIKFPLGVTVQDVYAWLSVNGWLGYHPAGYGPVEVKPTNRKLLFSPLWEYIHWSSCD